MTIEQLGGLDTGLLYCETPAMHMHVCGIALLDPSPRRPEEMFEPIRSLLLDVLPKVPMMRKKLLVVPFGMSRPLWVDDADFDLDRHLHRTHVEPPGDDRALADLVGAVASVPLARDRPLWEVWVVEGLASGGVGLLAKIHHAGIDGATALTVMSQIFDLQAKPVPSSSEPAAWRPEPRPSRLALTATGLSAVVRSPVGLMRLVPPTVAGIGAMAWRRRNRPTPQRASMLFRAPRTSFNASLTPRRSVAFTAVPLSDVKDIKDAYGVKVNDVIVAVTAEAVRRYLDMRGELPAKPLVAAEPISVHGRRPASGGTTRLTVMFSTMATDEKKPDERLRAIAAANAQAKEGSELMGADTLMRWSEYVWCYGYELGVRIYSSLHLADHHPVAYNLVLSNVAGPPVTLYLAEARCTEIFPFGPLFEGAGLNVTVISSDDRVGFGFIACPDLVSDVWAMADAVPGALNELRASVRRRSRVVASATGRSRSTRRRSYAT